MSIIKILADGKHIESLILLMFLRYLPGIVTAGKVYVANPPLYGLNLGKGKMKFFTDNIEYIEYAQSVFCRDNEIVNIRYGKKYSKNEIIKILYKNIDYVKMLTHVANTFAIDVEFLEFLLYNKDLSYAKFKSTVEKAYKYVKVDKQNNNIVITGLVGSLYQTIFFNDRLLHECKPVIDLIEQSDKFYSINGVTSTLYGLMYAFNKCEPSGLTRYKGLGKIFCPIIAAMQ